MAAQSASVEVLTAEVRTLQVGSRQVTLSVFRQLDSVLPEWIDAFGRVRPKDGENWIVGCDRRSGALVRASIDEQIKEWRHREVEAARAHRRAQAAHDRDAKEAWAEADWQDHCLSEARRDADLARGWMDLPLIVLAGLR